MAREPTEAELERRREDEARKAEQKRLDDERMDAAILEDIREILNSGGKDTLLIREWFMTLYRCGTIEQASRRTGIGRVRYIQWRDNIPGFKGAVERWQKHERLTRVKETMFERATNPNDPAGVKAAELLLKAYERETFGDKLEVDTRVTVQHVVQAGESARERALKRVSVLRERGLVPANSSLPAPSLPVQDAEFAPVNSEPHSPQEVYEEFHDTDNPAIF